MMEKVHYIQLDTRHFSTNRIIQKSIFTYRHFFLDSSEKSIVTMFESTHLQIRDWVEKSLCECLMPDSHAQTVRVSDRRVFGTCVVQKARDPGLLDDLNLKLFPPQTFDSLTDRCLSYCLSTSGWYKLCRVNALTIRQEEANVFSSISLNIFSKVLLKFYSGVKKISSWVRKNKIQKKGKVAMVRKYKDRQK